MPAWLREFLPIVALLVVVTLVVSRLPKVDLGHDARFKFRRVQNWLPVGLTYAFLYMGRYNLNTLTGVTNLIDKEQFSHIYGWGTLTYGLSFLINGPLTDRLGGKKTIVIAALGSAVANLLIARYVGTMADTRSLNTTAQNLVPFVSSHANVTALSVLYAVNMYFQSFGAVSIVKVNSAWFHLRERGTFGGIFGILISLGLYFAFDVCALLAKSFGAQAAFAVPAAILVVFAVINVLLVKDTPGQAGLADFDLGDATVTTVTVQRYAQEDAGYRDPAAQLKPTIVDPGPTKFKDLGGVFVKMATNPAIVIITMVEFCSGYLRNSIMQYYKPFAKDLGRTSDFVSDHWGMLLCIAGITGGVVAGLISDRVFSSRRGPVSAVLYGVMIVGSLLMFVTMDTPAIGWIMVIMSLAIIGVHGMLSGTASMDFAGKRNVGLAVGIIDGFVYLGTTLESWVLGRVLPKGVAAHDVHQWWRWPAAILPVAVIGFILATRLWNATPRKGTATGH